MSETYDRDAYRRYCQGDRDQEARDANAAYSRQQRAQAPEGMRAFRVGTQLSKQDHAVLEARLRELDVTQSDYFRDLFYADAGIEDTARRPAPKRRRADSKTEGQKR